MPPDTPAESPQAHATVATGRHAARSGTQPIVAPRASDAVAPAQEPPATDDPRVGMLIADRYRLIERVGEGGMGAVYRGEHVTLRKRVAVKFLHPELSRLTEVIARFEREAIAAANLEHANVVAAHDFGKTEDGQFFLVMEYVEGPSLRDILDREGKLEPERALHIARQIAAALFRAHGLGIVHRDLKPDNVTLVERDGVKDFAKVLDFGIAKVPVGALGGGKPLTQAGMVFGTPDYMAPEQALGAAVDARADQYAFGVLVFEMLSGQRPFDGDDVMQLLSKHMTSPPPAISAIAGAGVLPDAVDAVVARMLAKSPSDRFASVQDAMAALDVAFGLTPIPLGTPPHGVRIPPPEILAQDPDAAAVSARTGSTSAGTPSLAGPRGATLRTLRTGYDNLRRDPKKFRIAAISAAGIAIVLLVLIVWGFRGGTSSTVHTPSVPNSAAARPVTGGRGEHGTREHGDRPRTNALHDPSGSTGAARGTPPGTNTAAANSAGTNPAAGTHASPPGSLADHIAAYRQRPAISALLAVATGRNTRTVIAAMEQLRAHSPDDAILNYLIGTLYARQRNGAAGAIARYGDAIRLHPEFTGDPTLSRDVLRLFANSRGPVAGAEELIRGPLSGAIYDDLLAAGLESNNARGRERVRQVLQRPPFDTLTTAGTLALFDLQSARSCEQKLPIVERLGREGDERALPFLRRIRVGPGCGFLGLGICNACLQSSLPNAVAAIERRAAQARR